MAAGQVVDKVLDPTFLRERLETVRKEGSGMLSDAEYEKLFDELAKGEASPASGADPSQGEQAFLPRSAGVSILQSTLNDCILSRFGDLVKPLPPGHKSFADWIFREKDIFRKFGPCDADWIESVLSKGISLFEGKPKFPDGEAPEVEIADDVRIVVCGDWGTGLKGAQKVGQQMRPHVEEARKAGREVHALHLGDVYYSGWKEEYETRFLPYWPVEPGEKDVPSWSLNGNHDMYSGGHGYFGYLLRDPRFRGHNGSSYFSLANSDWQLLGLDTSYEEGKLAGKQVGWVTDKLEASSRKTMLLTHHQPFTAFEERKPYPYVDQLKPAFDVRQIDAWLWGHEHLCCVYEHEYKPFLRFGSCIGHGGVPVLHEEGPPPLGVQWRADGFEEHAEDKWQLFGFAVFDFEGPKIAVRYFDQNGAEVSPPITIE